MAICFYCGGNHKTSQCVSLATHQITDAQEAAAEATIDAVEKVGYRVEKVGYRVVEQLEQLQEVGYDVRQAIVELHDFLSWAHCEAKWCMERQINLLTGIHDILKSSRATQANELYEMGLDSFRRHRLPEAFKLLQEARELNPGDYRIHFTLGHIYAQMDNLPETAESFRAAVAYARNNEYKKDALLSLCRALRCLGQVEAAIAAAKEASSVTPNYAPAHYELATCLAERLKRSPTTK